MCLFDKNFSIIYLILDVFFYNLLRLDIGNTRYCHDDLFLIKSLLVLKGKNSTKEQFQSQYLQKN